VSLTWFGFFPADKSVWEGGKGLVNAMQQEFMPSTFVFRQGLAGFAARLFGGAMLVVMLLALDVGLLRTLVTAVSMPLPLGDWCQMPLTFGVLGQILSLTVGNQAS